MRGLLAGNPFFRKSSPIVTITILSETTGEKRNLMREHQSKVRFSKNIAHHSLPMMIHTRVRMGASHARPNGALLHFNSFNPEILITPGLRRIPLHSAWTVTRKMEKRTTDCPGRQSCNQILPRITRITRIGTKLGGPRRDRQTPEEFVMPLEADEER